MSVYRDAALATFKRTGSYEAAKREIARDRDNNSPGTVSFSFHNAALKELNRLYKLGELRTAKKNPVKLFQKRTIGDTELNTWFERDRQHVELRDKKTGKTLVEWWDEAVSEAVEDGFLDPRRFHESAFDYFQKEMGGKAMRKRNPKRPHYGRKPMRTPKQRAATARMLAANKSRRRKKSHYATKIRDKALRETQKLYDETRPYSPYRNPRRSKAPLSGFQVAALREGKILFLSGVAMTSNREAASNYSNVKTARHVARQVRGVGKQLGISKVAVVTKHDRAQEIQRFLLGGA